MSSVCVVKEQTIFPYDNYGRHLLQNLYLNFIVAGVYNERRSFTWGGGSENYVYVSSRDSGFSSLESFGYREITLQQNKVQIRRFINPRNQVLLHSVLLSYLESYQSCVDCCSYRAPDTTFCRLYCLHKPYFIHLILSLLDAMLLLIIYLKLSYIFV